MICLGILFGCQISSFESYAVTILVVIGSILVLRLLCYIIYRLVVTNRSSAPGEPDESDQSDFDTAGARMQLQNRAGNVQEIM
ncbi:hypothetical protein DCAR_0518547 [Daucus carota subsp. sativus]|uniref:Uncharacterized protein n=1 Tax=Daucus carota subsp. sativus TaxID=79200 RepID=A0AAF0X156_DAUCS|nr:hypothetical protein DCAR_0518547 [Daucus carota subsp. sativus]